MNKRTKNIVISGLPVSQASDTASVEKLCHTEFGVIPSIIKCRRLGQPREGRIQPTLVTLKSVAEAEFFIKSAKSLRQSSNPTVKSLVYISADLTKAEALRAYERRCRRRAMAAQRDSSAHASIQSAGTDQQQTIELESGHLISSPNDDETVQSISVLNTRGSSFEPTTTRSLIVASSFASQSSPDDITATVGTTLLSSQLNPTVPPFVSMSVTADVHQSRD